MRFFIGIVMEITGKLFKPGIMTPVIELVTTVIRNAGLSTQVKVI
jgi:hypothetical protein